MKIVLLRSSLIAAANACVRFFYLKTRREYSAPLWLPTLVAFAGAFIGAFLVLWAVRLCRRPPKP